MNARRRLVTVTAAAALTMSLGVGAALAATGSVSLAVTGAHISGNYSYDVAVSGRPGFYGVQNTGTVYNTGTTDSHTAYYYGRVDGYGNTQLAAAGKGASASVPSNKSVLYSPDTFHVTYSWAPVCRDRTLASQNCNEHQYK